MATKYETAVVDKLVLDKLQLSNGTGANHEHIVADGSGGISWSSGTYGGVLNPLTSDLGLAGFDLTGKGVFRAGGLNIPEPTNDVFPDPPCPPYVGITKYRMNEGFNTTAYRQAFQSNFNPADFFPSNATGMEYFNKCLIGGSPLATIGKINLGSGVLVGVEQNVPVGGQGATDTASYDPFNTRTGIVGSTYTAFGLNKALSGCGGVYDVDVAMVSVKLEIDYNITFGIPAGQAQVIIRVRDPPVIDTGVLSGTLLEERIVDLDLNTGAKTTTQGCRHFLFNPFKQGWRVGTTFEVFLKPTTADITAGEVITNFFVSPAC